MEGEKKLIFTNDSLAGKLFDKTIEFFTHHIPFGEVSRELALEVIEDYKKEMLPLFTTSHFTEE